MTMQDAQNISFRYKVQSALGTAASGSGGKELPLAPSQGLRLLKQVIEDPAIGNDGMRAVPRHGSRSVSGQTAAVVRLGALDELIEALCRGTWVASFTITQAAMTSITTTTNTIVAAGGSWITQGLRIGDVITLTSHSTAANNSKRLPVVGLTASTITVPAGYLTADAGADSSFTVTVHKAVTQGVTKRYFTTDTYFADIDRSITSTDCVPSSLELALSPDGAALATIGWTGINRASNASGASPVLTSPTSYETANMVAVDAVILQDGVVVTKLTGLQLTMDLGGETLPVIGATTSPDVFLDNTRITGSFSIPMEDLTHFDAFANETAVELMVLLKEPESEPYDFFGFHLGNVRLTSQPDWSAGGTGPLVGSISFEAGRKDTTTGYAETAIKFVTSAA